VTIEAAAIEAGSIEARAVVVRAPGEAAQVETIRVDPPAAGEVRVKMLATGVCHTDLHAKLGHFGRSFPYLLGHEATGVIEAVGPGVDEARVGQTVMLSWRAHCGRCRFCLAGRLTHCKRPLTAGERLHTDDDQPLGRVLGLGTFASHTVVAAEQAIAVDPKLPPEATCLIGCGVITGVGAAMFAAGVKPDDQVAVFGCGAVGLSVVQGARLARASRIIAIDRVPAKLEHAKHFGATDVVDASKDDPVEAVKSLSRGGVDHAFEAVGIAETLQQALASCGLAGEVTMIGVPHPKAEATLPLAKLFYGRHTLRTTFYGDCLPPRDFPRLAAWYARGELDLDALITARIGLDDVEEAFRALEAGEALRSVILFEPG
jgi:S-(hydroxymethyl)mycothiol dehydrogenase